MNLLNRLQRRNAIAESRYSFESEFVRESLRSERRRVLILAITFGVTPPIYFIFSWLFPQEIAEIFHGAQSPYLARGG